MGRVAGLIGPTGRVLTWYHGAEHDLADPAHTGEGATAPFVARVASLVVPAVTTTDA